jgi:hypothetical protein
MTLDVCVTCYTLVAHGDDSREDFGFGRMEWQHSSAALKEAGGTWVTATSRDPHFSWEGCELCGAAPRGRNTVSQL